MHELPDCMAWQACMSPPKQKAYDLQAKQQKLHQGLT